MLETPAAAAGPAPRQAEALAQDIANDLPSPYCPGRSISSCPSEAARELEGWILGEVQAGKDRDSIETELVARFGEAKVGAAQETGLLVGVGLVAAIAVAGIAFAGRRWTRAKNDAKPPPVADPGPQPTGVSPQELARIEDELAALPD